MPYEGSGVPNGIRTRVAGVKGQCPRPLDDGDHRMFFWYYRQTAIKSSFSDAFFKLFSGSASNSDKSN